MKERKKRKKEMGCNNENGTANAIEQDEVRRTEEDQENALLRYFVCISFALKSNLRFWIYLGFIHV